MNKYIIPGIALLFLVVLQTADVFAQIIGENDTTDINFKKEEFNSGFSFSFSPESEELLTDDSRDFNESLTGALKFLLNRRNWDYTTKKHEYWEYFIAAGPYGGTGKFIDSSAVKVLKADNKILGVRGNLSGSYSGRFYYDKRNFTLVSLNAWSGFDLYRSNAEGTLIDSNQVLSAYSHISNDTRFRVGFQAKAGWGLGRLDNINHFVTAARFLNKYYPQRIFSDLEISQLAREIGRIKNRRSIREGHSAEVEINELMNFVSRNMLLEAPEGSCDFWELTEFLPRYKGSRFGIGPFFNYLNYEPDFIYGGYIKFENEKYSSVKWNRNFSANISYNSYKKSDWLLMETALGWSYYPDVQSEFNFGIRYIPGIEVKSLKEFGTLSHNFVPYLKYFSQINNRFRMDLTMALRIASDDRFLIPGPEMSVNIYRSRY